MNTFVKGFTAILPVLSASSQRAITCGDGPAMTEIQGLTLVQRASVRLKHLAMPPQLSLEASSRDLSSRTRQFPVTGRSWLGADPLVGTQPCTDDDYQPSPLEHNWAQHVLEWTGPTDNSHCEHMAGEDAQNWVQQNEQGNFSTQIFSTLCRKGQQAQFIEPLAGVLRDPRFGCSGRPMKTDIDSVPYIMSVDWLVLPTAPAATPGSKSRFYDAGGSKFRESLQWFLESFQGHGIVFDEVYVWEMKKQGTDMYWEGVDAETRARWEPKLFFYDGVGVSADLNSTNNPVSRIFGACAPQDYCVFKLDIDTPQVELPLVSQLLNTPEQTRAKLDEFFFEHHVEGPSMRRWWGSAVFGTFADSYAIFGGLRQLGVRAHSWV